MVAVIRNKKRSYEDLAPNNCEFKSNILKVKVNFFLVLSIMKINTFEVT